MRLDKSRSTRILPMVFPRLKLFPIAFLPSKYCRSLKVLISCDHFDRQKTLDLKFQVPMVRLGKTRHQLKDQTMITDRCSNIFQLIIKLLETLTIGKNIRKILHASGCEILLKSNYMWVLIILKDASQAFPGSHGSGSFFHNGCKEIKRDGGINPLKNRWIKNCPHFEASVSGNGFLFSRLRNYVVNLVKTGMNLKQFSLHGVVILLHF